MFALVETSGRVAQLDAAQFPVAAPLQWIDCTSQPLTAVGWSYAEGAFSPPPAPPPPTLAQQAASMLATGCAVVSEGDSALNATYACDSESRSDMMAELLSLVVNGTFTNGSTTLAWPDVTGAMHSFTVAQFKAMATAAGAFVGALKAIIASNTGTLPAQPTEIA